MAGAENKAGTENFPTPDWSTAAGVVLQRKTMERTAEVRKAGIRPECPKSLFYGDLKN